MPREVFKEFVKKSQNSLYMDTKSTLLCSQMYFFYIQDRQCCVLNKKCDIEFSLRPCAWVMVENSAGGVVQIKSYMFADGRDTLVVCIIN